MNRVVVIGEGESRFVTTTIAAGLLDCSDDPLLIDAWRRQVEARVEEEKDQMIEHLSRILGSKVHQLMELYNPFNKWGRAMMRNDRELFAGLLSSDSAALSLRQLSQAESLLRSPTPVALTTDQAPALAAFLVDFAAEDLSDEEPPSAHYDSKVEAAGELDEAYAIADVFGFSLSQACLESIQRAKQAAR